jgi:hypothetical protein
MESALAVFPSGYVIQPARNRLAIEEGKLCLGIMPAVAQVAMGLKLVSVGRHRHAGPHLPRDDSSLPAEHRPPCRRERPHDHGDAQGGGVRGSHQATGAIGQLGIGAARERGAGEGTSRGVLPHVQVQRSWRMEENTGAAKSFVREHAILGRLSAENQVT